MSDLRRDAVVRELGDAGIGVGIYYPIPVHRQPYVMELGLHADLPQTDVAAARTLSLPMYPGLTEAEQREVVDAVRASVLRNAELPAGEPAPTVSPSPVASATTAESRPTESVTR